MAVRAAFQLFLAICVGVFVCGCRMAFTPLPRKETRTYQSLLEWSHENGMPGAILLVQTPQTNFLGALGWADVKRKIPIRPEHEFRIGSITKMFTGLTVLQLERDGLLKTDSVITNYLPKSITDPIANSDRITVKHLLQHGSGIYDFLDNPRWILRYAVLDRRGDWPPSRHLKYVYVWFGSSTLGRDRSASGRFERILEQALFDLTLERPHGEREDSGHAK